MLATCKEVIGKPHLEKRLSKVVGLMQAADTRAEFKRMFRKVFKTQREVPRLGRGTVRI